MQTVSVVLATFNEEKNLPVCLDSIKDIAKEIVIVDGTSTDKTVEIAKKYGAKVVITDNPPVFHINKQKAIDMAMSDWILQLDADERVSRELGKEIEHILAHPDAKINGYWMPRKNWFLGRFLMKGGQYPDYTLRLYKKGKGRLPQKDVHEQAIVDGKVGYLKNPLIHIADPSFSRYVLRWQRYTSLMARQLAEKEPTIHVGTFFSYLLVSPFWWFFLIYFRHKGFMDGWQGFIFAFFSGLRFPVSYIKYVRNK
ncbi:MAG TPA: glycosyltransferase family 2 protein [Candidatus Saccharimonadales bacterium]|nr:glycosyltransferase family 2 protein [Candidatus Saccharimonadales bacterium]